MQEERELAKSTHELIDNWTTSIDRWRFDSTVLTAIRDSVHHARRGVDIYTQQLSGFTFPSVETDMFQSYLMKSLEQFASDDRLHSGAFSDSELRSLRESSRMAREGVDLYYEKLKSETGCYVEGDTPN